MTLELYVFGLNKTGTIGYIHLRVEGRKSDYKELNYFGKHELGRLEKLAYFFLPKIMPLLSSLYFIYEI